MNHEVGLGLEGGSWVNVPRELIRTRWELKKKLRCFQSESTRKALINRSDELCFGTTGEYVMPNLTFLTWWPDHVNSQCIIFKWKQKNVIFMVQVSKHSSLKRHPRHRSRSGLVVVKGGHKNSGDTVVKFFFIEWTSYWDQIYNRLTTDCRNTVKSMMHGEQCLRELRETLQEKRLKTFISGAFICSLDYSWMWSSASVINIYI